jgi:hypothetical protein
MGRNKFKDGTWKILRAMKMFCIIMMAVGHHKSAQTHRMQDTKSEFQGKL